MIRYTLRCEKDHTFEAWFRSSADYDRAAKRGGNECPLCGGRKIEKAPMAPSVARTDKSPKDGGAAKKGGEKVTLAAAPDPREMALRAALKELRQKVTENAEYVGDRFAAEARKIHYNEGEARGIYGEATADEAKALAEEGIEFQPLPTLPEERN
jgi:hypothetical protein